MNENAVAIVRGKRAIRNRRGNDIDLPGHAPDLRDARPGARARGRRLLLVVLACVIASAPAAAFDDFETWHTARGEYKRQGAWSFAVGTELRLRDDSSRAWFIRVSQECRYRANDRWLFDANVSWIRGRIRDVLELDDLRLELAATPRWRLSPRVSFDLRGRADWWLREGDVPEELRIRLRPRILVRIDDRERGVVLFFGDEVHYSDLSDDVFQNRVFPIGASLPVGSRARVDLYLMVFSNQIAGEWIHDLVLGQTWTF